MYVSTKTTQSTSLSSCVTIILHVAVEYMIVPNMKKHRWFCSHCLYQTIAAQSLWTPCNL